MIWGGPGSTLNARSGSGWVARFCLPTPLKSCIAAPVHGEVAPLNMAKAKNEAQLLNLLKSVLPKAVPDAKLAQAIYSALEKEIAATERVVHFEKFCKKVELPDLQKASLAEVKEQFEASFGKGTVSVVPHAAQKAATVEVITPKGTFEGIIQVGPKAPGEDDDAPKPKYGPFPVSLPADQEVVWLLARDERLTPDEAVIALAKVQDTFWESKAGQQHLRKRTERTFPEFMSKVPGKVLSEVGLKRHYKEGEAIKQLKLLKARKHD